MNNKYNSIALWFIHHLRALTYSLGEFVRAPIASLMTVTVIGVAVALPMGFYLLLQNFQAISRPFDGQSSITLYLKQNSTDAQIKETMTQIEKRSDVRHVQFISPAQGLNELKQATQLGDILDTLSSNNPLPPVLSVVPAHATSPSAAQRLLGHLKTLPLVDTAVLDMTWVQRLFDLMTLAERIIYTLAFLFGIGVVLIIGNTIRLTTQMHRQEMNILKLVGATHAFILRPLLYRGILYGLAGGLLAWLLVSLMLWWLAAPAEHLAASYGAHLSTRASGFKASLEIILLSTLMGWVGSWIAVRRHLTAPEVL